jgi:hypothetical protein
MRNVVTIATALVGILVSLKSGKSSSPAEHYLFSATIGLIALGILSGVILLYGEIQLLDRKKKAQ